jgi:UDP-N-acetylglucosamine acyltransferase
MATPRVSARYNNLLAYTHVAHDCQLGSHIIMSNNATLAGHITVEDHVVMGGFAAAHQFCRIGKMAMIGGYTKVVQDVVPFTITDGNPAATRTLNKVGIAAKRRFRRVANGLAPSLQDFVPGRPHPRESD